MPTYNEKLSWVEESIKSILNQTFKNFELIVVHDNPNSPSLASFVKDFSKTDKRIKVIFNKKNLGPAGARNKAIQKAKGKYIAIMDSDDISLPKRLEIEYNFLENNHDFFLVGSWAIIISENGKRIRDFKPPCTFKKLEKKLPKKNMIIHSTVMYRNDKRKFYREKMFFVEDYDLYLRLLSEHKKIANIPMKMIYYRIRENSDSVRGQGKRQIMERIAQDFYFQKLKYGKDNYETFNPKKFLEVDFERTSNKLFLESAIRSNFGLNNFRKTRKLCKKYFNHYGIFNKFFIYYLLSFTGKRFVNFLRLIFY